MREYLHVFVLDFQIYWTFICIKITCESIHISLHLHRARENKRDKEKEKKRQIWRDISNPIEAKHKKIWLCCWQPQQKNFQLIRKWNWMSSFVSIIKTIISSAEGKKPINLLLVKRIFHCFPQSKVKSLKTKCEEINGHHQQITPFVRTLFNRFFLVTKNSLSNG